MAEIFTGKLTLDKTKWKIVFFDEKKQKDSTLYCQKNVFASDFKPKEGEEIEVHFERDATPQKNPIKVRAKDAEWKAPARTVQAAPIERGERNAPHRQADNRGSDDDRSRNQGNQTRRENMRGNQTTNQNLLREFHNPYNFVPALPRPTETLGELGDHEPSGHDRFIADKLSGKLSVKMTVETPLLLLDTAKVEVEKYGQKATDIHKKFPVRVGANGKPEINPTAIKGMLRSAYEAVTNSRLSVFQKHDERLAFRMDAKEGIYIVPARIERQGDNQQIVLCPGSSIIGTGGAPQLLNSDDEAQQNGPRDPMYAAWLGRFTKVDEDLRVHGKKVWAYITRWRHQSPDFLFWNVVEIRPYDANPPTEANILDNRPEGGKYWKYDVNQIGEWVEGYVCLTMYRNKRNIKNRHDERLFFDKYKDQQATPEVVTEEHRAAWKELIVNYRQEHDNGKGGLEPAPREPVPLEWSRHIHRAESEKALPDDTLCYARVTNNEQSGWRILELLPVMIARRLHSVAPEKLLAAELHPAYKPQELSPADRVFGWVRQSKKERNRNLTEAEKVIGAYRGQIRIGVVSCERKDAIEDFSGYCISLQILGQPKPQQGRFYIAETQNGEAQTGEAQTHKRNNQEAGYKEGRGLRGRKVYPHHANLPDKYWVEANEWKAENNDSTQEALAKNGNVFFREYIRPKSDKRQDSQNRSIQGWVKKGVEFKFDIHFINLSKVELGALIWLLQLNNGLENSTYFHRFGGGKPLGFGSVRLDLNGSEAFTGEELKQRYESLGDISISPSVTADNCKTGFENAVKEAYPNANFLGAFKRSAKGFDDNLPIHYPRARHYKMVKDEESDDPKRKRKEWVNEPGKPLPPHVDGLAYEWFVANNQVQGGQVKYGYVLPDLIDRDGIPDKGLEILSAEVKDKYQNAQNQNRGQRNPKNRGGRRR